MTLSTFTWRLGKSILSLSIGFALAFLPTSYGYVSVWEGLSLLVAVTVLAYFAISWATRSWTRRT